MEENQSSPQFEESRGQEDSEASYLKVRLEGNPGAWLFYGLRGHESEYVVNIDGYDWDTYIPREFSDKLQEILGQEFYVMNRGSRIEITRKKDDASVEKALELLLARRILPASDVDTTGSVDT